MNTNGLLMSMMSAGVNVGVGYMVTDGCLTGGCTPKDVGLVGLATIGVPTVASALSPLYIASDLNQNGPEFDDVYNRSNSPRVALHTNKDKSLSWTSSSRYVKESEKRTPSDCAFGNFCYSSIANAAAFTAGLMLRTIQYHVNGQ